MRKVMSNATKSDTTKETTSPKSKGTPLTEVQARMQQELKQGFRGIEIDPTPNENYTFAGVTSGAPTPETDAGSAKAVRIATGTGLSALEASALEKDATAKKRSNK